MEKRIQAGAVDGGVGAGKTGVLGRRGGCRVEVCSGDGLAEVGLVPGHGENGVVGKGQFVENGGMGWLRSRSSLP